MLLITCKQNCPLSRTTMSQTARTDLIVFRPWKDPPALCFSSVLTNRTTSYRTKSFIFALIPEEVVTSIKCLPFIAFREIIEEFLRVLSDKFPFKFVLWDAFPPPLSVSVSVPLGSSLFLKR